MCSKIVYCDTKISFDILSAERENKKEKRKNETLSLTLRVCERERERERESSSRTTTTKPFVPSIWGRLHEPTENHPLRF